MFTRNCLWVDKPVRRFDYRARDYCHGVMSMDKAERQEEKKALGTSSERSQVQDNIEGEAVAGIEEQARTAQQQANDLKSGSKRSGISGLLGKMNIERTEVSRPAASPPNLLDKLQTAIGTDVVSAKGIEPADKPIDPVVGRDLVKPGDGASSDIAIVKPMDTSSVSRRLEGLQAHARAIGDSLKGVTPADRAAAAPAPPVVEGRKVTMLSTGDAAPAPGESAEPDKYSIAGEALEKAAQLELIAQTEAAKASWAGLVLGWADATAKLFEEGKKAADGVALQATDAKTKADGEVLKKSETYTQARAEADKAANVGEATTKTLNDTSARWQAATLNLGARYGEQANAQATLFAAQSIEGTAKAAKDAADSVASLDPSGAAADQQTQMLVKNAADRRAASAAIALANAQTDYDGAEAALQVAQRDAEVKARNVASDPVAATLAADALRLATQTALEKKAALETAKLDKDEADANVRLAIEAKTVLDIKTAAAQVYSDAQTATTNAKTQKRLADQALEAATVEESNAKDAWQIAARRAWNTAPIETALAAEKATAEKFASERMAAQMEVLKKAADIEATNMKALLDIALADARTKRDAKEAADKVAGEARKAADEARAAADKAVKDAGAEAQLQVDRTIRAVSDSIMKIRLPEIALGDELKDSITSISQVANVILRSMTDHEIKDGYEKHELLLEQQQGKELKYFKLGKIDYGAQTVTTSDDTTFNYGEFGSQPIIAKNGSITIRELDKKSNIQVDTKFNTKGVKQVQETRDTVNDQVVRRVVYGEDKAVLATIDYTNHKVVTKENAEVYFSPAASVDIQDDGTVLLLDGTSYKRTAYDISGKQQASVNWTNKTVYSDSYEPQLPKGEIVSNISVVTENFDGSPKVSDLGTAAIKIGEGKYLIEHPYDKGENIIIGDIGKQDKYHPGELIEPAKIMNGLGDLVDIQAVIAYYNPLTIGTKIDWSETKDLGRLKKTFAELSTAVNQWNKDLLDPFQKKVTGIIQDNLGYVQGKIDFARQVMSTGGKGGLVETAQNEYKKLEATWNTFSGKMFEMAQTAGKSDVYYAVAGLPKPGSEMVPQPSLANDFTKTKDDLQQNANRLNTSVMNLLSKYGAALAGSNPTASIVQTGADLQGDVTDIGRDANGQLVQLIGDKTRLVSQVPDARRVLANISATGTNAQALVSDLTKLVTQFKDMKPNGQEVNKALNDFRDNLVKVANSANSMRNLDLLGDIQQVWSDFNGLVDTHQANLKQISGDAAKVFSAQKENLSKEMTEELLSLMAIGTDEYGRSSGQANKEGEGFSRQVMGLRNKLQQQFKEVSEGAVDLVENKDKGLKIIFETKGVAAWHSLNAVVEDVKPLVMATAGAVVLGGREDWPKKLEDTVKENSKKVADKLVEGGMTPRDAYMQTDDVRMLDPLKTYLNRTEQFWESGLQGEQGSVLRGLGEDSLGLVKSITTQPALKYIEGMDEAKADWYAVGKKWSQGDYLGSLDSLVRTGLDLGKATIGNVIDVSTGLLGYGVASIGSGLRAVGDGIDKGLDKVGDWFKVNLGDNPLGNGLNQVSDWLGGGIGGAFDWVGEGVRGIGHTVAGIGDWFTSSDKKPDGSSTANLGEWAGFKLGQAWNGTGIAIGNAINWVGDGVGGILNWVGDAPKGVGNWLSDSGSWIQTSLGKDNAFGNFANWGLGGIGGGISWVGDGIKGVGNFVTGLTDSLSGRMDWGTFGSNMLGDFKSWVWDDGLAKLGNWAWDGLSGLGSSIAGWFK
ncbi:MAG: hypothetical protein HY711_06695 [Candidatus Melainabacteria bacterium]|nr:hypothetical protein [Candidatus Melainabacteria bacterium]